MIPVASPHPPGLVGVTSGDTARYGEFFQALDRTKVPDGSRLLWQEGYDVCQNRNCLVKAFQCDPAMKWLWFLDDDHAWPDDTLLRLLDRNVSIVQPLTSTRIPPFHPISSPGPMPVDWKPPYQWRSWDDCKSGLLETKIVGAGGLLVSREVLLALQYPWFYPGRINLGALMEDTYFSMRATEAQINMFTDCDVAFGHLTTCSIYPEEGGVKILFTHGRGGVRMQIGGA